MTKLAVPASLLAIAALAVAPALAQAEPLWFNDNTQVPVGETVSFTSHGVLTLHVLDMDVTCDSGGAGNMTNSEEGPGTDEVTQFSFRDCMFRPRGTGICPEHSRVELSPAGLPWQGRLFQAGVVRDEIDGVELELACSGTEQHLRLGGTVFPEVGPSQLEFDEIPVVPPLEGEADGFLTGVVRMNATSGNKRLSAFNLP